MSLQVDEVSEHIGQNGVMEAGSQHGETAGDMNSTVMHEAVEDEAAEGEAVEGNI